jgi:RNA polymerase sigma-70 factor, ECF subfamily
MDCSLQPDPERLLAEARAGNRESLGALLERYRAYLQTLVYAKIDLRLQARANPSDLIQETFLLAIDHFEQFRGRSEGEWLHWLRCILRRRLSRFVRKHAKAGKRNVYREVSLQQETPRTALAQGGPQMADRGTSPSGCAGRREVVELMAERLSRLSQSHREVLVLRNLQGLSFQEVARRMHRSPGAVRVLWLRALDQLRRQRLNEDWL